MLNTNEKTLLEWEALDDRKDPDAWLWLVLAIIASAGAITYSALKKEWLMGAVFVVGVFVVTWNLVSKTKPIKIAVTTKGVWIGSGFYDFEKLKGYYFSTRKKVFFLEPKNRIGVTITFPIGDKEPGEIKNLLPSYLVEIKEKEEDFIDRLSKKLRF